MPVSFGHILLILLWASAMLGQAVSAGSAANVASLVVKEIDEHYLYASDVPWKTARTDILKKLEWQRGFASIGQRLAELHDSELHLVSPSELSAIQRESEGASVGTGLMEFSIDIDPATGEARIVTPLVGSPSATAGLQPKDAIVSINGSLTRDLDHEQALDYLRSAAGADLRIRRGKRTFRLHLVPSGTPLNPVTAELLPTPNGTVAYVRILQFTHSATAIVRSTILKFELEKPHGYILDLRNNPGGFLDSASQVGSFFVSGQLGAKVRRNGEAEPITAEGVPLTQAPVVVLVNEGTASAAEFVAGALQGRHRGRILGAPTYGRGQAQVYRPLVDGYGVIIPSALIRTPDGRLLKGAGLMPDVLIRSGPQAEAGIEPDHDSQLRRAILLLSKGKQ